MPLEKHRTLSPKPLLDEALFLEACDARNIKRSHVYSMYRKIIQDGVTDVNSIPGLPKSLYQVVSEEFAITTSKVEQAKTSKDGSTTKMLVRLQDGKLVESVVMRYGCVEFNNSFPENTFHKGRKDSISSTATLPNDDTSSSGSQTPSRFRSNPRATLCISSQVGCSMGCTFCATGTMGLTANLLAGEILEQLYHANKIMRIRNVVFMGMGEPLDNYTNVLSAIRGMADVQRFSLGHGQISLSTVGVAPKLKQLADEMPFVNLALSLHAPNQELRSTIVPSSKAWHLDRIMGALDYFIQRQRENVGKPRNVLIEYVLISDINDSPETAHELGSLLQNRAIILNVIPYNPTEVPHDYKTPPQAVVDKFNKIVREYGVRTIQRQELGQDIDGACGQLVVKTMASGISGSSTSCEPSDLEDLMNNSKQKNITATLKKRNKPSHERKEVIEKENKIATPESKNNPTKILGYCIALGLCFLVFRVILRLINFGS
eukprot:m.65943 g.65943  ORF g.65943 m.65943 type:complete len:489 (+) comp11770_c0_seq1:289-1755(+)